MIVVDPKIETESVMPPRAEFQLVVPGDLLYLRGHFPGKPVLPGVVQIHWAIRLPSGVWISDRDSLDLKR